MIQDIAAAHGQRSIRLGSNSYNIYLMPAIEAMQLASEIFILLAPTMASIFDKVRMSDTLLPEEDMSFTDVAFVLVKQLKSFKLEDLCNQLLSNATVNGQSLNVNDQFRGKLKDLTLLLEFAIKENGILDFFTEFLREKGLEIPTLREMMEVVKIQKESTQSELSSS